MPKTLTFSQIQRSIGGECALDADYPITGLATLSSADSSHLSFLASSKYRDDAAKTRAAAVLVRAKDAACLPSGSLPWIVGDPYLAYATLSALWRFQSRDESQQAAIASSARLGEGVVLGPGVSIGPDALIGDRVRLGPGVHIGAGAVIAAGCELRSGVVIEHVCEIGPDVLIHANTVIGSDGFGFARNKKGEWIKIHQLGSVYVAADVEIGSHCSIDRGALDHTSLGRGAKLDNQIQIGHNVQIGDHCAIAGCVGIAGSTVLGHRVMVGGGAGILGHLKIADDVVIAAMSLISQSISEAGTYGGVFPQMRQREADRSAAVLKQLPSLRTRVMRLETDIEQYWERSK